MIPNDGDVGQLSYRQCKRFAAAEDRIACQERDRPGKSGVAPRFNVPGLQRLEVVFARSNLGFPVKGHTLAVAESVYYRYGDAVFPAGAVTDVDEKSAQIREVTGNRLQGGDQIALADAFQLQEPDVTECSRPAITQHPRFSLSQRPEPIIGKSLLSHFEKLRDLFLCEFLPEPRFFFRAEVSPLALAGRRHGELDMPIV